MPAKGQDARERLRFWLPIVAIVLVAALLRFWRLGRLALIGDEAYYWLWSRHLDWSYYDNPGATAWMIYLSTLVGGPAELGVRWLNALLGVVDVALVYGIGKVLFSARAGAISAALLAMAAPYILTSRFVYTDGATFALLLTNMLLLLPVLVQASRPAPWWRWLLIGASGFLLLQTKLSVYPYFAALASGIVLWRRDLAQGRALGLATAGAALGVLPTLWWNAGHGWTGLRWIVEHSTQGAILASSRLGSLYHAFTYLTPPLVLACLLGLALARHPRGRWLAWIALWLLAPVLISPADSPRNLLLGTIPLLGLSGGFIDSRVGNRLWKKPLLLLLLGATLLYGLGTVLATTEGYRWPENGMAQAIRADGAGRRSLAAQLRAEAGPIVTVDYSLAAQLTYYMGRPVYTPWGQYRLWGIPDLDQAMIVSLDYLPVRLIEERLRGAYTDAWYLREQEISEGTASARVHLWRASGMTISQDELLDRLDFLTLYRASAP